MLKKIPIHQLRVGMYIQEVCCSWMDHPFWRASFLLQTEPQLAKLAEVKEVVIDTIKGLDVLAEPAALVQTFDDVEVPCDGQGEASYNSAALMAELTPDQPPAKATCTFQQEIARATAIVAQSRAAMKAMFQDVRLGKAVDAEHCLPVVDEITQSVNRNPGAIVSLARLKTSDDYTYMHSVAVCALMVSLANQLGLSDSDRREAGLAGLVHDLGKAMMPPDVLNKPGSLTPEEFAIMKGHPEAGHRLLVEGKGVGPIALDVCLHHHEKVNGKGYPKGLKGDEISLFAKMGAVCDVYDAITSNRPYKSGWDPAESIQKMALWAKDGHFDEGIFHAFVKSVGIYPTGSMVRLQSGRLGVVVEQGQRSLLSVMVRAFFSINSNRAISPVLVDLNSSTDRIVSRESAADWGFQNLDKLWQMQG
jgi:HD-GYP domain-containing protein (c-di-GMP phosphodiesterase class II)